MACQAQSAPAKEATATQNRPETWLCQLPVQKRKHKVGPPTFGHQMSKNIEPNSSAAPVMPLWLYAFQSQKKAPRPKPPKRQQHDGCSFCFHILMEPLLVPHHELWNRELAVYSRQSALHAKLTSAAVPQHQCEMEHATCMDR